MLLGGVEVMEDVLSAVKRGTTTVGLVCTGSGKGEQGVVLASERRATLGGSFLSLIHI